MADHAVTVAELASWLGVPEPEADDQRFGLALRVATGWAQRAARQKLLPVANDVAVIRSAWSSGELWLPERPVTSVSAIKVGTTTYTNAGGADWTLEGDTLLTGWDGSFRRGQWACWPTSVTVTYSHGFTECPDDVRGVILSAASRIVENPAGHGSYTEAGVGFGGAAPGGGLSPTEKATLEDYRPIVLA